MERIELVMMTPEKAKIYLDHNEGNRKLSDVFIAKLQRAILTDSWKATMSSPISVDTNGNLIDGQHRLTAIVRAGKAVPCYVVYGCDPMSKKFIDTGKSRTVKDVITMLTEDAVMRSNIVLSCSKALIGLTEENHRYTRCISPEEQMEIIRERYLIFQLIYKMNNFSTKSKVKCVEYFIGLLSGEVNGLDHETIQLFNKVVATNNVEGMFRYNVKAALDFRDWYLTDRSLNSTSLHKGGRHAGEVLLETKKALCKFANNKKSVPNNGERLYPLTKESLDRFEKYLEEKEDEKNKEVAV